MKEKNRDRDKDKEKGSRKSREEAHDRSQDVGKDDKGKLYSEDNKDRDATGQGKSSHHVGDGNTTIELENVEEALGPQYSTTELQECILRMKGERVIKRRSESSSEVLPWVNRSRWIEEQRNSGKEKALQLKKIFEEQDNTIDQGESDEEKPTRHGSKDLAGVKVLHGLDKVIEGGPVVLTLKDQAILANGELNEDVGMLQNVEIGEQKWRDEAYKAAKKTTGIYEDKFNDEPGSEKKILPQYDDPVVDEGLTLDSSGRFTGEAEKKLEELRRRLLGVSTNNHFEDLNTYGKSLSDYYTHEEMLQFKKPKKKKCLRKKEKLNIDALEAEAVSAGLGVGDLGPRSDGKRQSIREEQETHEAEMRNNAYQSAYAKADEASKALRLDQTHPVQIEDNENLVSGEDDEDLLKSLQRARNRRNPDGEDEVPKASDQESKDDAGGWTKVKDTDKDQLPVNEHKEEIVPDDTMHEVAVGKGLSGALKLLKERGTLEGGIEWGGRNTDKKKSKLVGIYDNSGAKEIRIERTDQFGQIMTPKEAFRMISHKFHGRGPSKMKQEKRMKQHQLELKLMQMKDLDTPSRSVERMREAQSRMKTPFLVLGGHVKPGQTSDPRSGFATTVEKEIPGMLRDRKVEHFLGKRKAEPGNMAPPKKSKT